MKKIGVNFLIFNLVLSIFAFCFILNLGSVRSEVSVVNEHPGEITSATPTPTTGGASSIALKKIWTFENGEAIKINKITDGSYQGTAADGTTFSISKSELEARGLISADGKLIKSSTGSDAGDWLLRNDWADTGGANFFGHMASGLVWATTVVGVIQLLGGFFDDDGQITSALSYSAFAGIMAGKAAYGLFKSGGWWDLSSVDWMSKIPGGTSGFSIGIGVIVAAIVFFLTYEDTETEIKTFTCNSWDAPTGGDHCEDCNKQNLPCSEYQCRSLGQACQLVNPNTEEAKCVWVNRNDVKPPVITPWEDVLKDGYAYYPGKAISPPDRGTYIKKNKGCVGAFEAFTFGITTDEPAKCKIDYLRKDTYDEMSYYFGGSSTLKYNHTQVMSLPNLNNSENLSVTNGGEYELYVRCQDANGNHNIADFVFQYCVEEGPDTTAPLIVSTSLQNGMPVGYNQSSLDLEVYVNEPAECKWSHDDTEYSEMEKTMSCSSSVTEINAQMLYTCQTTLNGIKNEQENKFYFRCKDQPNAKEADRNANAESYEFIVIGTQPLVIGSVKPEDGTTIRDSIENVKVTLEVETNAGYKEGEANCYYSDTGEESSYVMFYNTSSHAHYQELYLPEGEYTYYIKCIDLGGNSDEETTHFWTKSDSSSPNVVRTFYEESYLVFITDEESQCVYDVVNCNYLFDDGIEITTADGLNHYMDWNTDSTIYVKCADEYGNKPAPDKCNIIVKPVENIGEG